jgi:hypothetical protein
MVMSVSGLLVAYCVVRFSLITGRHAHLVVRLDFKSS